MLIAMYLVSIGQCDFTGDSSNGISSISVIHIKHCTLVFIMKLKQNKSWIWWV